jgi:hypothetical protein
MHEIGDYQVPMGLAQGYTQLIEENGKGDLYRIAYVESATHCGFNVAESAVAIETMMRRLDTGSWGPVDPASLNALGASMDAGVAPRFIDNGPWTVKEYNRIWRPGTR